MEVPQGNSLCGSFKQAKISFFLLIFFLYKIREWKGAKVPALDLELVGGGGGGKW
jgi:hypothetical protein